MRAAFLALGAALIAGPAAAGPAPASGDPMLGELQRYCIATEARADAAMAAADADGWMEAPQQMLAAAPPSMSELQARLRTNRESMRLLFAGRGTFPAGGEQVEMDICMVGAQPADFQRLSSTVATWIDQRPAREGGDMIMYAWAETPEGRRPLASGLNDRDAEAALQSGTMRLVLVLQSGEMAMVGYATPRLRGRDL